MNDNLASVHAQSQSLDQPQTGGGIEVAAPITPLLSVDLSTQSHTTAPSPPPTPTRDWLGTSVVLSLALGVLLAMLAVWGLWTNSRRRLRRQRYRRRRGELVKARQLATERTLATQRQLDALRKKLADANQRRSQADGDLEQACDLISRLQLELEAERRERQMARRRARHEFVRSRFHVLTRPLARREKIMAVIGLTVGLAAAMMILSLLGQRYEVRTSGGSVVRMDRWTGAVWARRGDSFVALDEERLDD